MATPDVTPSSFLKDGWAPFSREIADEMRDLRDKLQGLSEKAEDEHRNLSSGEQEQVQRYVRGIDKLIEAGQADNEQRRDLLQRLAQNPHNIERVDGDGPHDEPSRGRDRDESVAPHVRTAREAGLRAIERNRSVLSGPAADRLDATIRGRDPSGLGARYLAAVADPAYGRAFGRLLQYGSMAHLHMSREEQQAVAAVTQADQMRAMSLTGSAGGFGVPFELDPSIMLSSNGAINPIRELATVTVIAVDEWRGVSSAGITAAFAAEATETTDNAPTLAQPTISTEKAQAFVPFSIEIGMDYAGLRGELAKLLADAKDVLEATVFLSGTGTNEPQGILTGLTTTQRVQTDVAATLDIDDAWDLRGTFGATRFAPSGTFAGNPGMLDRIFRMTPSGSTTEPQAMPDRGGPLMGRPTVEISTMVNTTTTGSKVLLIADFAAAYRIVDRIGLSIELIPHLFGTNHRPTGSRGLYAFWRVGAGVQVANAARYLEVL